jgi:hypothetical protein
MWLTNFALLIFQIDPIGHVVQRLIPNSLRKALSHQCNCQSLPSG